MELCLPPPPTLFSITGFIFQKISSYYDICLGHGDFYSPRCREWNFPEESIKFVTQCNPTAFQKDYVRSVHVLRSYFLFVSKAFHILGTMVKPVINLGQLVLSQAVQNWIQFLHEILDLLQILSIEGTSVVSSLCSVNTRHRRSQIQTHTHIHSYY